MSIIIIRENVISPNIKKNDFWAKSKRGEGTVGFFQNSREPLKLKCKRNIKILTINVFNKFSLFPADGDTRTALKLSRLSLL